MEPIRILIVDDHALFRTGIATLLCSQPDIEVVGEARDGLEGAKLAGLLQPDVVLLDLRMPGISGHEALRIIGVEAPRARVLMFTTSEDAADLADCLRAGASGYLLKFIGVDTLTHAIRNAARGTPVIAPRMAAKLAGLEKSRSFPKYSPPKTCAALS